MAPTPSLRVIKQMTFMGVPRLWSNRYHFNGGTPANDSAWHTLMDNVTAAEKLCTNPSCTIVSAVGYAAGSDVPVSSKTYALVGLASQSGMLQTPGDVAGLIRYSTAARTTKNHPVYLFNYMHGAQGTTATPDVIGSTWKSVLATYATAWISGFSDGSVTYNRAGPNGASATGSLIENYLTHRDFPR